jgi:hypothetical protein
VSTAEIDDVDGDGRGDSMWLSDTRRLGIQTAAGGRTEVQLESGSPIAMRVLVVDADLPPPVELFVSDGRSVQLWAFEGCALRPVLDEAGAPYLFDLQRLRGNGTGVGCVGTDERRLVGLDLVEDDGTTVRWERTTIELDGLVADEGETESGTFTHPEDDQQIGLLTTVSCGDRTLAESGLTEPGAP